MFEINYIDQQFFIITKPQDKNSLNWPVGNGHSSLGLQIYFFIISEKAEHIDYGHGRRVFFFWGGGTRIEWAIYILTLLISIMLTDFHHLLFF